MRGGSVARRCRGRRSRGRRRCRVASSGRGAPPRSPPVAAFPHYGEAGAEVKALTLPPGGRYSSILPTGNKATHSLRCAPSFARASPSRRRSATEGLADTLTHTRPQRRVSLLFKLSIFNHFNDLFSFFSKKECFFGVRHWILKLRAKKKKHIS